MRSGAAKRIWIGAFGVAFALAPSLARADDTVAVRIVRHECGEEVRTADDFERLGGFSRKLAACPAAAADEPGAEFARTDAGYSVKNGSSLAGGGLDETRALCGAGDCGGFPSYEYAGLPRGEVTLIDDRRGDTRFGALSFVPKDWDGNDDADSLVSYGAGIVNLDTTNDSDGLVTLHVFDFAGHAEGSEPSPAPEDEGIMGDLAHIFDRIVSVFGE